MKNKHQSISRAKKKKLTYRDKFPYVNFLLQKFLEQKIIFYFKFELNFNLKMRRNEMIKSIVARLSKVQILKLNLDFWFHFQVILTKCVNAMQTRFRVLQFLSFINVPGD